MLSSYGYFPKSSSSKQMAAVLSEACVEAALVEVFVLQMSAKSDH
jgi:hypothetical protein